MTEYDRDRTFQPCRHSLVEDIRPVKAALPRSGGDDSTLKNSKSENKKHNIKI